MLAFESAVHETCRADVGRWETRERPGGHPDALLTVTRVTADGTPPRHLAAVLATSDLRLSDSEGGWDDETARANASLMADALTLLLALARFVDAAHYLNTGNPRAAGVFTSALAHAEQLLMRHAETNHAADWWDAARSRPRGDVAAEIEGAPEPEGA